MGKGSIRGLFAGILFARARSVVTTLFLFGVGRGKSSGVVVCQFPPSRMRSWLPFEAL